MKSVFNVLFIWLFITLILDLNTKLYAATLWPGLFAQSVLRTPLFWPPNPLHNTAASAGLSNGLPSGDDLSTVAASAEQHMINSDEPIPSGLFIPIDQLHRELYTSPHLLRKHSSNHYPSYQQFNLNHFHHHPNKKLISSSKHHHYKTYPAKFKQFNKNFYNKKKNHKDDDFNAKYNYLDDFYNKHNLFNLNKLNGHFIEFEPDFNQELGFTTADKNWQTKHKQHQQTNRDQSLINQTEDHTDQQDEDDLFTKMEESYKIKNNSNELPGRIDLRKSNKRKQALKDALKDNRDIKEFKIIKEFKDLRDLKDLKDLKELRDVKDFKEFKGLKDTKEQLKPSNENRYIENYDNQNNQNDENDKVNENRNIEKYNLERFLNQHQEKLNQKENRNDGRIAISNTNQRKEKSNFNHQKNLNGDLSVISETIYQNHQNLLKNDNRRSPSRLILMQNYDRQFDVDLEKRQNNNESITNLTNDNLLNNETDDQTDLQIVQNTQSNLPKNEQKSTGNNKIDLLNEEQINQQLYGTTLWNAQRVIPTPQISYMQSMFTESNTLAPTEQTTKTTTSTYQSERSQLNNNTNNHFSTLAISCIIVASLIAALLFTGSSLFLMYKVSQIKKRRLMRFQDASRNQFESSFPVQATSLQCKTTRTNPTSLDVPVTPPSNHLNNNIISNNNFIRQQKSLFSNLNTRCNAGKTMLSINEQIDSNFTIKNKHQSNKTATINKKTGKHLNLSDDCFVTQIKTSTDQKNSALSRLISKMSNQTDEANKTSNSTVSDLDEQHVATNSQRVSFF